MTKFLKVQYFKNKNDLIDFINKNMDSKCLIVKNDKIKVFIKEPNDYFSFNNTLTYIYKSVDPLSIIESLEINNYINTLIIYHGNLNHFRNLMINCSLVCIYNNQNIKDGIQCRDIYLNRLNLSKKYSIWQNINNLEINLIKCWHYRQIIKFIKYLDKFTNIQSISITNIKIGNKLLSIQNTKKILYRLLNKYSYKLFGWQYINRDFYGFVRNN